MTNVPPITDHLAVSIRAYAEPTWRTLPNPTAPNTARRSKTIAPASEWTLVIDTETTTDAAQSLRFGAYQWRKGDQLIEGGIIYDPEGVTEEELSVIRCHADANGLVLRTRESFVDEIFFAQAYQFRASIIGFNLPFDISRIAISHGSARSPQSSEVSAMRGGFTFKLSRQKIYPNIRVKHMSSKAALISFAAPMGQRDSRGQRNRGIRNRVRRGHFIDVKTLAHSLFAKGFSLASLSQFLNVQNPKLAFDEFDGPITDEMVRYAVRDVQATWECFEDLSARFAALNLSQTKLEKIYSEASIGKAYIRQMGIAPWRKVQPVVPSQLLAKIMGSYFGGRSEVRIRREVREVMLCDFLSMYPTVCTLMGLWRFVIADGMTWCDATDEARTRLANTDLASWQSQSAWADLTMLVRVKPDADIFPVRAAYSGEGQATIGANYLTSDTPLWFTLADCIAAKLLTGKAPRVVEAISFAPGPIQSGLGPIDIAGNPEYRVDPNTTDFFKRVIELRQSIKTRMRDASGEEQARLDTEQNALKICANSTSYGIWVEINVETRPKRRSVTVHNSTGRPFSFPTDKAEMPGSYFHPLLATLITGAARLMLAIAERLAIDKELEWVFCDTDSMAFAKPLGMHRDEFASRTATIIDWFSALNPYEFGGSILKSEDVNTSLETYVAEPLYCFAISSKRYALFNFATDGSPVMRKVSAHGLGHLRPPYSDDDAPTQFPKPHPSVLKEGTLRWHCDLWHQIVSASLAGHPDRVNRDYHNALSQPAVSRYSATSPDLLRWFRAYNADRPYRDQVKPFGFLLSLSEGWGITGNSVIGAATRGRRKKATAIKPIAPFDSDPRKAIALAFDRETGALVSKSALRSFADALAQYHISPESKFINGDFMDRGTTFRRHVQAIGTRYIGKEANLWEEQFFIGLDGKATLNYGISEADPNFVDDLKSVASVLGRESISTMTGLSGERVQKALAGNVSILSNFLSTSDLSKMRKLAHSKRQHAHKKLNVLRSDVERLGLRGAARLHGLDPSNLRRVLLAASSD